MNELKLSEIPKDLLEEFLNNKDKYPSLVDQINNNNN
jgi:hypothetical protein